MILRCSTQSHTKFQSSNSNIEKQIQWSVNWERMDDFKAAKITLLFDKTIEKKEPPIITKIK